MGNVLTRLITFLLLPFYTNILKPSDYGLATLVFVFIGFMNIIYNYGLDSSFMRFYSEDKDEKSRSKYLSTAIWLSVATSIFFSLIVLAISQTLSASLLKSDEYKILFVLTSGIIFLDSISHVPFAFLRFREKSKQFINIKIVNVLLTFGLNIYFVAILKKGISGIFISNFIASLVTTIILYLLILPSVRFLFDFKKAKSMVNFGIPFIPAGLSATTMQMIDRYILKNLTDISTVGIYSAGYKLGIFMLLITSAFYYAWQPFFLKMGKKEESRPIFARVFTYFIAITSFLWILVSAFIHELIHFKLFGFSILGPEYYDCESIIPIILLAYIFQGVYLNFLPGIYFEKKTKYITIFCGLGALVNVLLNFILIPLFGILGAAFATLAGFVVLSFSTYWVSQKLFYVPYEWKRVLIIVFAWTISSFLIFISSGSILIKLLAVSLLPIFLTLLRFFEKEELNFLKNRGKSA